MQGLSITPRAAARAAALVVGLVPATLALPSHAAPAPQDPAAPEAAPRPFPMGRPRVALRLLPGASPEPFAAALGGQVVRSRPDRGWHLLTAADGLQEDAVASMAAAFKAWPTVLCAEIDEPVDPPEAATCGEGSGSASAAQCTIAFIDTYFQPADYYAQSSGPQIGIDPENPTGPAGNPMVVGMIDTGIEPTHPLLSGLVLSTGYDYLLDLAGGYEDANGLDDDEDGMVDEGAGHGTHVAGLIHLVDPAARFLSMRVLDSEGNGSSFLVGLAIMDAVDDGAHVINLSLSARGESDALAEGLMYAEHHGVPVVASAGNTGGEPTFPATYDPASFPHLDPTWLPPGATLTGEDLLAVGGVNQQSKKMAISAYGSIVDLCAPGRDAYSSYHGGQWATWTGTSMSCGLGSGAVSRMLSIWGQGGYSGSVLDLLRTTAHDLDGLNPSYAGGLGEGLLDAGAAEALLLGN